ncbi:putative SPEAR family protein [Dioscorea sansibarensis]
MVGDGEPSRPRHKTKHRRPPQRGLGVAELEKIRLEEQHKVSNATTTAVASSVSSPRPSTSSASSQPKSLPFNHNPVMFSPLSAFSGSGPSGHFGLPMPRMDHTPESLHRKFRCRPNPGVNRMALPMASGVHLRMEPPSNQIYYRNCCSMPSSSSWPDEDRNLVYMVGMKRPCSVCPNFSWYPCKVPSSTASFVKMNNHSPLSYGDVVSRDPEWSSGSYQADLELKHAELHVDQSKKENGGAYVDGGFLTLGSSLTPSSFRSERPIFILSPENFANLSCKANVVDNDTSSNFGSSGPITSSSHYHTFFPSRAETQEDAAPGNFEETEDLDLSLKL